MKKEKNLQPQTSTTTVALSHDHIVYLISLNRQYFTSTKKAAPYFYENKYL